MRCAEMEAEAPRTARAKRGWSRMGLRAEWLVLGSVLLASTGQLTIKSGLNHGDVAGLRVGSLHLGWPVLLGLLIYGLGTVLWIQAVSKRNISYLYPLSAFNYTLVALGGTLFLGERFGWDRWLGIAVMSLGVALLVASQDAVQQ